MDNFPNDGKVALTDTKNSNPILIVAAWLVVGVPLAWGVTQTAKTSMALFKPPAPVQAGK